MVEIIPAILASSEEEFREKVKRVGTLAKTIQIDVMDGRFVPNRTWADPAMIAGMRLPYIIEAHLMVTEPEKAAEPWIAAGARRIFVHSEAGSWRAAVKVVRTAGRQGGVAINPATTLKVIADAIDELDAVLVMGVTPGWSGQEFQRVAVEKIVALRQKYAKLRIEVDGGVSAKNAGELARAGANGLVAASALFGETDFARAFAKLERAANQS